MSRLTKRPVIIPEKVEVETRGNIIRVKGPGGELSRPFRSDVSITVKGKEVFISSTADTREARVLAGTYASHLLNMIEGVQKPYEHKLVIEGIGFKAELAGKKLILSIGFSHPVEIVVPENLSVSVEKNVITVKGIDKDAVGAFTALIRRMKKPEPYKGKGIRYIDEVVRRKQGKRAATA